MKKLYHMVPEMLRGNVLKPLNRLKESDSDIYREEAKKYEGRIRLLRRRIPILDCLWNDVIFLTAIHPQTLSNALCDAGLKRRRSQKIFEIDPLSLDARNTLVYLYNRRERGWEEDQYVPFDPEDIERYAVIPDATQEYFKKCAAERQKPFHYHLVPHILFRGEINITDAPIITC